MAKYQLSFTKQTVIICYKRQKVCQSIDIFNKKEYGNNIDNGTDKGHDSLYNLTTEFQGSSQTGVKFTENTGQHFL